MRPKAFNVVAVVLLAGAVIEPPCPAASSYRELPPVRSDALAPKSIWEKGRGVVVVSVDSSHMRCPVGGKTRMQLEKEIQERRERLKRDGQPIPMLSDERKKRIAKLIRYYLGDALNPLIQRYFLDIDVVIEPVLLSGYEGVRLEMSDGSVKREIRILKNLFEVIEEVTKNFQEKVEGQYKKSGDYAAYIQGKMAVDRMADLVLVENILHEIIALHLIERSFELNDEPLRYGDPVEGEFFEESIMPFLTRNLPEEELERFIEFHNKHDDALIAKGFDLEELHKHFAAENVRKWRELPKDWFRNVVLRKPDGLEWFERGILPYYKGEEHYTGKDVADVVKEAKHRHPPGSSFWPEILRRPMLEKMAAALGFDDIAEKIIAYQNVMRARLEAVVAAREAAKQANMEQLVEESKKLLRQIPIYRALELTKEDPDMVPIVRGAHVHASEEIVVDISLLANIEKMPGKKWKCTPYFGSAMDMLAARDILYGVLARFPDRINKPREQVRLHILHGDLPEQEARNLLQKMGLAEGLNFATLAKDADQLMEKIRILRKEEGYDKGVGVTGIPVDYSLENYVRMDTFFIMNPDSVLAHLNGASNRPERQFPLDLNAIKTKFKDPAFPEDDPIVIFASPNVSLGEAIGFGAAMHHATPKMNEDEFEHLFKGAGTENKNERAYYYFLRWLSSTVPQREISPLRYIFKPGPRVAAIREPTALQTKLREYTDTAYAMCLASQ